MQLRKRVSTQATPNPVKTLSRRSLRKTQNASPAKKPRRPIESESEYEANAHEEEHAAVDARIEKENALKYADAMSTAIYAVLALAAKGPIKETELKHFFKDFKHHDMQDNLREFNKNIELMFGYELVKDPTTPHYFLRNQLLILQSDLSDLTLTGLLDCERIDDGTVSGSYDSPDDTADRANCSRNMTTIFAILTSIMMSANIDVKQPDWLLHQDRINTLMETLGFDEKQAETMLKKFQKEGWIRISQTSDNKQSANEYHWGARAILTVRTAVLFEKFCVASGQSKLEWLDYEKKLKRLDSERFD